VKVKRPNAIIYFLVYILIYPLLKILFRLETDRSNFAPPKGPFLVVSNHSTFMDFLVVMLSIYPRRLNAVTAQKFFLYKPLHWLLPMVGCIPKNLFDPDMRSIQSIKTVLKRGDRILMFPEGRCSTDGAYAGIHKSTGKLVKNLGVPVISCRIDGAYICMPYWRKGFRTGRVRLTISELFSHEDIKNLSVDEINNALDLRLSGSDTPPPRRPLRTFGARRLVEGLQGIIYLCPKCMREFTLETEGNKIRCTACGNEAIMEKTTKLSPSPGCVCPDSVQRWFSDQTRYEMSRLSEDMDEIIEQVTVRVPAKEPGKGVMPGGAGTLRLTPKGWYYTGELSGENVDLFFPIESVPAIPFDANNNFQIYANGSFFMFTPQDERKSLKYALLGECMHRRFAPNIVLTPGMNDGFKEGGC